MEIGIRIQNANRETFFLPFDGFEQPPHVLRRTRSIEALREADWTNDRILFSMEARLKPSLSVGSALFTHSPVLYESRKVS